ncbi:hypothetical protein [Sansalvadorimonas verongulae]|uniref:hypothetical protein n=1 Tax=Sansalvadorimonas verongulae TaxID=2172824 RepID=UPI0012BCB5B8|nr:hypothetical protein [Sansalvadorimonas verongulae]MTI13128.1 hypothetical protein [Sansalvadorimonas verongulae]
MGQHEGEALQQLKAALVKTEMEKGFLQDCVKKAYAHFNREVPEGLCNGDELADMLVSRDKKMPTCFLPEHFTQTGQLPDGKPCYTQTITVPYRTLDEGEGEQLKKLVMTLSPADVPTPEEQIETLQAATPEHFDITLLNRLVHEMGGKVLDTYTHRDITNLIDNFHKEEEKKDSEAQLLRSTLSNMCHLHGHTLPKELENTSLTALRDKVEEEQLKLRHKLRVLEKQAKNLEALVKENAQLKTDREELDALREENRHLNQRISELESQDKAFAEASSPPLRTRSGKVFSKSSTSHLHGHQDLLSYRTAGPRTPSSTSEDSILSVAESDASFCSVTSPQQKRPRPKPESESEAEYTPGSDLPPAKKRKKRKQRTPVRAAAVKVKAKAETQTEGQ